MIRLRYTRFILLFHRILGTALSVLFLMWFVSGIVMMYHTYPSVSPEARLQHAETMGAEGLQPMQELRSLWPSDTLPIASLTMERVAGMDLARLTTADGQERAFSLRTGQPVERLTDGQLSSVAARWSHSQPVLQEKMEAIDVWLIGAMPFREYPVYHYAFADDHQSEVYLSSRTGRVLQFTDRRSRFWAWVGAIPHWVYITKLRATGRQPWTDVVLWLSGFGIAMTLSGLMVGVRSLLKARRRRRLTPYVKPAFRWHHLLGLGFGLFVLTWIFSGFMSLADAPQWLWPVHEQHSARDLWPDTLSTHRFRLDYRRVLSSADVRTLQLMEIAGEPVYRVETAQGTRLVHASDTVPTDFSIDDEVCRRMVTRLHGDHSVSSVVLMDSYDNYYVSQKHRLPLPVYKVSVSDADRSTYYINPSDGACRYYNTNRRAGKWMYTGLHSLNTAWMTSHPTLRQLLMWLLLLGGTAVSLTGFILAVRRIRRGLSG